MKDTYKDFAELSKFERTEKDYRIRTQATSSELLVLAIHGGRIEQGTSEMAIAIAEKQNSYYLFEGMKSAQNRKLHISSSHFDEPTLLSMLKEAEYVLSIHGYKETKKKHTLIGGLDEERKKWVYKALRDASFSAEIVGQDHLLSGTHKHNVVNKGKREKGVQLEISYQERDSFFLTKNQYTNSFYRYVAAVQLAFVENGTP
ncbi:poly-gamma-glutamate hydrolase family protein [Priestia flexa]|uniref:poly-gamma-glutamate hydrolase family protein n=1 Tax=Priestia flexa TaxID=86664 RepID=UPI002E1F8BDC|nr:poly-gamma-glutamate hydrolase family protein [Priestia flexa]